MPDILISRDRLTAYSVHNWYIYLMITKIFSKDLLPLKHRATTKHPPSQVENVQLCISQTPVAVEPGYNDDDDDDDDQDDEDDVEDDDVTILTMLAMLIMVMMTWWSAWCLACHPPLVHSQWRCVWKQLVFGVHKWFEVSCPHKQNWPCSTFTLV